MPLARAGWWRLFLTDWAVRQVCHEMHVASYSNPPTKDSVPRELVGTLLRHTSVYREHLSPQRSAHPCQTEPGSRLGWFLDVGKFRCWKAGMHQSLFMEGSREHPTSRGSLVDGMWSGSLPQYSDMCSLGQVGSGRVAHMGSS